MKSFVEIIQAFGGTAIFAEAIGIPDSHARAMKARRSIPHRYWRRTVKAAQERHIDGITTDSMAAMVDPDFETEASQ
jgi:hypothetical protein